MAQSVTIFSESNKFEITGSSFIKIHEFYNNDSVVYDFNTSVDGAEGLIYSITQGNDLGIFEINNMGVLKVVDQPELLKQTTNKDSTFFDLTIKAKLLNLESSFNTRIYSKSIQSLSIEDTKQFDTNLKIYPNPANEYLQIQSKKMLKEIIIYNFKGREIKSFKLNYTKAKLDIHDIKPGMYVLKIITKEDIFFKRIIVN